MKRGMTYEDLCYGTLVLSGVLMKEALIAYDKESGLRCAVHRELATSQLLGTLQRKYSKWSEKNSVNREYVHYVD